MMLAARSGAGRPSSVAATAGVRMGDAIGGEIQSETRAFIRPRGARGSKAMAISGCPQRGVGMD